jgi:L-amino acid N-acyltransferase YncA
VAASLAEKGDRYPTVVVEREGEAVAWAGAGAYRSRPAYAGVAEHSVYVARAARGTGAGRAALEGLCREYAARGFWKIVSRIFPENRASLALHERCGFRVVGVYRRHGKLDGAWRDCVIVERPRRGGSTLTPSRAFVLVLVALPSRPVRQSAGPRGALLDFRPVRVSAPRCRTPAPRRSCSCMRC